MGIETRYEQLQFDIGGDLTLQRYGNYVHPEDAYITVATKTGEAWIERNFKKEEWLKEVQINPYINSYNSVNTFFMPKRNNSTIRHLNAFFVDLDIYNVNITKETAIKQIDTLIEEDKIPTPTFIIDSGRGLYAIWKINSVPGKFKNVQRLYGHIQNYLIKMTSSIGSDPQASDMARVLRTPGTYNTKSNTLVTVLKHKETDYCMRYLQAFMNVRTGYNPKKAKKKYTKKYRHRELSRLFNFYSLAVARENDIKMLCKLRNYDVIGHRNAIIHIYAYQSLLIEKNKHVARAKVSDLNEKFIEPLKKSSISEVINSVYRAYKDHIFDITKGYNYRNDTIIERLNITPEEQKEMKTLISKEEKRQRDYAKRREKRRGLDGLTKKQREKVERKKKILALHKKGLSIREIANKLDRHYSTVSRDINQ